MTGRTQQTGFSLIELLIAATVFTFVASGVSGLFVGALNLQRRATSIQRVEENALFVLESIAREIRVSRVTSGDTVCVPPDPVGTRILTIEHPVNGTVTYRYRRLVGTITRNGEAMTADDVNVTAFAFCVSGSGGDNEQTRVTMPITLESIDGSGDTQAETSLQTTVVSRDLTVDLTQ